MPIILGEFMLGDILLYALFVETRDSQTFFSRTPLVHDILSHVPLKIELFDIQYIYNNYNLVKFR